MAGIDKGKDVRIQVSICAQNVTLHLTNAQVLDNAEPLVSPSYGLSIPPIPSLAARELISDVRVYLDMTVVTGFPFCQRRSAT